MKHFILYFGGFIAVLAIGFLIHFAIVCDRQQAIIAVINQAHAANVDARRIINFRNGRSVTNFVVKIYVSEVQKIPTAQCPENFRLAWLNYIQTLERQHVPFSGLGAVTEFEISAFRGSSSGTKDALARLDKLNVNDAWMNVETAALDNGVQLVRE
jgi:hypothetical protein